jgi:hypothetical protein
MANEWDRQLMPPLMQTGLTVSLGIAYKSIDMMLHPKKSFDDLSAQLKEMVTIPEDSGDGVEAKAKALAGVWMEKGMTAFEVCRKTGGKFTADE